MFTNRWLGAAEAADWGLVNYVVADENLQSEALAYCHGLAKKEKRQY